MIYSTSGMSTSAANPSFAGRGKNPDFDPTRKWGLLPAATSNHGPASISSSGKGTTYVMPGRVISMSTSAHIGETIGREKAERERRRREEDATEDALATLLARDANSFGAKAVQSVRKSQSSQKGKEKEKETESGDDQEKLAKSRYSAQMLRRIGFDPTMKAGDTVAIRTELGKRRVCSFHVFLPFFGELIEAYRWMRCQKGKSVRSTWVSDLESESDQEFSRLAPPKTVQRALTEELVHLLPVLVPAQLRIRT